MAVSRIDEAGLNVTQYGNRNLVINGAMTVAQRGSGPFTNASGGYQTVDRFQLSGTMGGSFTLEQASDAPSGSGFDKSFKALVPTGFPSPTSTASSKIITSVEAQDLQHLMYGSSDAVTLTLSFWVKATVTGTYIFELYGDDTNRTISEAYTISTSNTWEKKTITIEGDVSGTINNDNGSGLSLVWWLGAGSNFTSGTLQTTWGAYTVANRAVGQVNAVASNNDAFYITGVQLEVGDTATPFEHRSYGDELLRCQRYYEKSFDYNTAPVQNVGSVSGSLTVSGVSTTANVLLGHVNFAVVKRAVPAIYRYNPFYAGTGWSQAGVFDLNSGTYGIGTNGFSMRVESAPTLANTNLLIHWVADSEL